MRILVYSIVDQREPGGVQMVIAGLVEALRARGHRVTEGMSEPVPRNDGREWRCPLYLRPAGEETGRSRRRIHWPSLARAFTGLIRLRPQIVNVHFVTPSAFYFFLLRRIFRFRIVLSVHGSDILRPLPSESADVARLLAQADAVTVVSEDLRDRVLSVPDVRPSRVHLIPNGVDCEFWTPAPSAEARGKPGRPPSFVAIGRLQPVKGYDILLSAFARLREQVPEARLCLVGDGPQRDELERASRSLGLERAVEFAGALGKEAIRQRLWTADAFVMSSRSEGMPLALLEAMACGVPCVATRVGGVPGILEGRGILVEPENPKALAEGMASILADPAVAPRLGARAQDGAQGFSRAASDGAYASLFDKLQDPAIRQLSS